MEFIKHAINVLAYPYWSFTLSLILFVLMLRSKRLWTKRGGMILLALGTVYFLVSLLDPNFRSIVAKEDKQSPLSDEEIVDEMARHGLKVARRTVTKYRQALMIPSSRQRKQF